MLLSHWKVLLAKALASWVMNGVSVMRVWEKIDHVDGLVQDCSNSSANALELLQSYTKPSML